MSLLTLFRTSVMFRVGGIFLLVGVPFLAVSLGMFYDDWRFSQDGRSTTGTVLTKKARQSGRSRRPGRRPLMRYEVTYRFTADGVTHEGRDELSQAEWEPLQERHPVEVVFLPDDPSSSRLAGPRPWLLPPFFGLLGSIFTAIGATIVVRSVRHARLEERLRQHGVSTRGTVTELRQRNVKVNRVPLWRLHYEYSDFQTHRHVRTIDLPEDEAMLWKVGDAGKVLYDPQRPIEAVWLGRDDSASEAAGRQ